MKKILVAVLVLVLCMNGFSQTKTDYLDKSKKQKTAGFILLGIGATCLAIAAPGNVSFDILPILAVGGSAAAIGSIPLFIAAGKNKRKAMSMSFQFQKTPGLNQYLVKNRVPSVSLKITL